MTTETFRYCDGIVATPIVQTPGWLLTLVGDPDSPITLVHVGLYGIVVSWKGPKSEMPWPSIESIAARAGISERTALRLIKDLEVCGAIRRIKRGKKGGGRGSNAYRIAGHEGPLGESVVDDVETDGDQRCQMPSSKGDRSCIPKVTPVAHLKVTPVSYEPEKGFKPEKENPEKENKSQSQEQTIVRHFRGENVGPLGDITTGEEDWDEMLALALSAFRSACRKHWGGISDRQIREEFSAIFDLVEQEAETPDAPYAVAAIADRMHHRSDLIRWGCSDPLRSTTSIQGIARLVVDNFDRFETWIGVGNFDMVEEWDHWATEKVKSYESPEAAMEYITARLHSWRDDEVEDALTA